MRPWSHYFLPPQFVSWYLAGLPLCVAISLGLFPTQPSVSTVDRMCHYCLSGTNHSAAVSQTLPASMELCLTTALPNSQAAKVRPQVHLGRQMLVLFVMTFAKTCTLLLTSFRRMVDTKGPWKRTFKKLCGGIKITEAEMLASCSNQGSLVFPAVLCIWPGSPQAAAPTVQHVEGRFLWQHQTHSYQETKRKLSVVKGKKSFL